jgi:hypothetical protein
MLRCVAFAGVFGLSLYGSLITPARPEQNKGRDIVYESARNRIGLLRFCRSTALLDRSTADVAIKVSERGLNALPTPETRAARAGDDAQAQGEAGVLGPDGKRDIADFAVHFKTTPGALCKEWAAESLRGVKGRSLQQQAPRTTSATPPTAPAETNQSVQSPPSSPAGETTGSISGSPGPAPLQSFAPVRQFDGHGWYK